MDETTGTPKTRLFADCVGVFQGGGCRAAAHAGAYAAARERGVNFHELAGASAGAIVAALIAAGASPDQLDEKLESLDFKAFLQPPSAPPSIRLPRWLRAIALGPLKKPLRLVTHQALYSSDGIERWMDQALCDLLPQATKPSPLFRDLKLPVAVLAAGLRDGRAVVYGYHQTPHFSVARAVRASCAMPFFFEAFDGQVDGGVLSNLPAYLVNGNQDDQQPVLAFALEDGSNRNDPSGLVQYANALVDTVVKGSQELQTSIQSNVEVISINTGEVKATDFDKISPHVSRRLRRAGYKRVEEFFGSENLVQVRTIAEFRTSHSAETLDVLTSEFLNAQKTIRITSRDTSWVFELFAALTCALRDGVKIRVLLSPPKSAGGSSDEQRTLLRNIGCEVAEVDKDEELPVPAFLFDRKTPRATAVIMSTGGEIDATIHRYSAGEGGVLRLLDEAIEGAKAPEDYVAVGPPSTLEKATEDDVIACLRPVSQYSADTHMAIEQVPLDKVNSWARYAMRYKQRQQRQMLQMFRKDDVEPFEPAWLRMAESRSLLMPPVVEVSPSGESFTIVNGASRLLLLQRENFGSAKCVTVRGVESPPPARGVISLAQMPVQTGRRRLPSHRYNSFTRENVRDVEQFAHRPQPLDMQGQGAGE